MWAVGACTLLPWLLQASDKWTAAELVAAVALAMVPISMDRLASFSHPLMPWDDAAKLVEDRQALPGVYRIYYKRGSEFIKLGDYDSAISDLRTAARLYREWPFAHGNLGFVLLGKGEWKPAVQAFTEAIEIADRKQMGVNPKPYYGRAIAYESLGEHALARKDYELICRLAQKGCEKLAN